VTGLPPAVEGERCSTPYPTALFQSKTQVKTENLMRLFEGTPFDRPPRCERCGELEADCVCPPAPPLRIPPEKQTARLAVEKRKKGTVVTVVRGLPSEGNDLPALLTQLKSACGAGGTIQDDALEIQGNHLDSIRNHLGQLGYKVRG
jgi:translation initiation factor 1